MIDFIPATDYNQEIVCGLPPQRGSGSLECGFGKAKGHRGAADLELFKEPLLVQQSRYEGLHVQRESPFPCCHTGALGLLPKSFTKIPAPPVARDFLKGVLTETARVLKMIVVGL